MRTITIAACLLSVSSTFGQFTNVYNIPSDELPEPAEWGLHTSEEYVKLFSDTQLNLFDGGQLPEWLTLGTPPSRFFGDGTENIEANIFGGVIGEHFNADYGSTVNISGGLVKRDYNARSNSVTNISGGVIEEIDAYDGSEVNITGGTIAAANFRPGSIINLSGGRYADDIYPDGQIHLTGSDLRIDGVEIEGLTLGNTVSLDFGQGVFSGTFVDGTPFAFRWLDNRRVEGARVDLTAATSPPILQTEFLASRDLGLPGVRAGQTMIVDAGAELPKDFVAGLGSRVLIQPGSSVGTNFEAAGADVVISGGLIRNQFDAFGGSHVQVDGGVISGDFDAYRGSQITIAGGTTTSLRTEYSQLTIEGGAVENLTLIRSSQLTITGGDVARLITNDDDISIVGTEFAINGTPISGLSNSGDSVIVEQREVQLTGKLADGTDLDIFLDPRANLQDLPRHHLVGSRATLRLVLQATSECDFNADELCNIEDIDLLVAAAGTEDAAFDLNSDGIVDSVDVSVWLNDAGQKNLGAPYLLGDATLDGVVDAQDLNRIGENWLTSSAKWSTGDFHSDGLVDVLDLNKIGENWLASTLSEASEQASVPEPTSFWLILLGLVAIRRRF